MKKLFLTALTCLAALIAGAQRANYDIIPLPQEVKTDTTQTFTLQEGMGIAYDSSNAEITRIAQFVQEWVKETTGMRLELTPDSKTAPLRLALVSPATKDKKSKKKPVTLSEQEKEKHTTGEND